MRQTKRLQRKWPLTRRQPKRRLLKVREAAVLASIELLIYLTLTLSSLSQPKQQRLSPPKRQLLMPRPKLQLPQLRLSPPLLLLLLLLPLLKCLQALADECCRRRKLVPKHLILSNLSRSKSSCFIDGWTFTSPRFAVTARMISYLLSRPSLFCRLLLLVPSGVKLILVGILYRRSSRAACAKKQEYPSVILQRSAR